VLKTPATGGTRADIVDALNEIQKELLNGDLPLNNR
jgi:hypothetical protein